MLTLRKADDRGHADHGWLQSHHSFSFAEYFDPAHMSFGNLRVLNDDIIAPGTGFGTHGHRDMEIVSYVLAGALAHQDSLGTGAGAASGVIRPGDVQRMSAGTGVRHSEFNHSAHEPTHLLQIWLLPDQPGLVPSYEQIEIDPSRKRGRLALIAAPETMPGAVKVNADARIFAGLFDGNEHAQLALTPGRLSYVHLARGHLCVNGQTLHAGDAALLRDEADVRLDQGDEAEVLVFDLKP